MDGVESVELGRFARFIIFQSIPLAGCPLTIISDMNVYIGGDALGRWLSGLAPAVIHPSDGNGILFGINHYDRFIAVVLFPLLL